MEKDRLDRIKELKETQKVKTKDKAFKNLSAKQKDELLETMAKMLGLID